MHRSIMLMSITSRVFSSTLFLDLDAKRHEVEEICEGEFKSKRQQRREENPAALGHVMMEADSWCVALNDAATRNCWTTSSPFPFVKDGPFGTAVSTIYAKLTVSSYLVYRHEWLECGEWIFSSNSLQERNAFPKMLD